MVRSRPAINGNVRGAGMSLWKYLFGRKEPPPLPSCPYCGKPLATDTAKRCFECGWDWHNPDQVVMANEHLVWAIEPGWKCAYGAEDPVSGAISEFIAEGDDINNWKELITMCVTPLTAQVLTNCGSTPEEAFELLKMQRELQSPGLTSWHAVAKDETSILYEWQARPITDALGNRWPEQHEIVRLLDGKNTRFRIAYTVKTYSMPSEARVKWIQRLLEARVEPEKSGG